jgi:hypothetical protein
LKVEQRKIYIDMDGVPVDFDSHFEALHGVHPKVVGEENFWKVFDTKRDGFFRDCPPYDGHLGFLDFILEVADVFDYGVEMLTALPRRSTHPTALQEKQEWMHINGWGHIKMNAGPYAIDKQKWYKPGDILIDDKDLNIQQWNAKGGTAIHHTPGDFLTSMRKLREVACHPELNIRFP